MRLGRAWIVGSLALAVSYTVAALTPLNQWIGFWLRGSVYTAYQILFMGALLPCAALLAACHHKRPRSLVAIALSGASFGYLVGLFALLFHPLLQHDGVALFIDSLRISTPEALIALLWFPIRLLSWLYGAMVGLLIPLVVRIINRFQKRFCFLPQITMTLLIGLWPLAWLGHGWAAEPFYTTERGSELERIRGPVRQMTVTTKDSITTLRFSSNAALTEKITRNRADSSDDPGETTLYRYDAEDRKLGEYVADPDGEVVPLRLYAYNDKRQIAAEAAYHMCRTFSSLHVYSSDERNRIIEDVQFESRRLTRREFEYDPKGQVERVVMHRNGKLMAITRYTYDEAGHVRTAVSEQPDGSRVRRLYQYDEYGNVIVFIESHPLDSGRDKTEITTYEYDRQGNWIRRTIIRAVNPLDAEGLPFEEPVEVIEREIVYAETSTR